MSLLNIKHNSKLFFSTVNLQAGDPVTDINPSNTHEIEFIKDTKITQSVDVVEVTTMESGLEASRATYKFNRALLPVDWTFTTYLRPTSAMDDVSSSLSSPSANVKPLSDWFLWQAMVSNTSFSIDGVDSSVWRSGGKLPTDNVTAISGSHASRTSFAIAQESHLYAKLDNLIYQVSNATVNQATIDGSIDTIASTTWTGYAERLYELQGTNRDNAVSVFGGALSNGNTVSANSNSSYLYQVACYHPYSTMNVGGNILTSSYIKNRLSEVRLSYAEANSSAVNYTFPVTAITLTYTNNITYLTPDELSVLNIPIGQFTGTRAVTGSLTAFLRDATSAQFVRNIQNDARISTSAYATANIVLGSNTAPYVAFSFPAVHFAHPKIEQDAGMISTSIDFIGQATSIEGGELTVIARNQEPASYAITTQDLIDITTQAGEIIYT